MGLIFLFFFSLGHGTYSLDWSRVLGIVLNKLLGNPTFPQDINDEVVLFQLRLPRIILAILVGGALASAGAAYQSLFRNPMAAPDILGVSSGAGVGASLAILWGLSSLAIEILAFIGGLMAVLIVMGVTRSLGPNRSLVTMILVGVVVSSLFAAFGSLIKYLSASTDNLANLVLWLMGSFAHAGDISGVGVLFFCSVLGIGALLVSGWGLNALTFGEEEALSLGVDVFKLRILIILASTLLTATSVALCGIIGWVGLIVPHLVRFLVGPNFTVLLPLSYLMGALFTLGADILVRLILPGEMPVGIVTSIIGAPFFIYILWRTHNTWY
ncbi:MAG: iron ABC transporter permease [Deltaproteobacteria bacterium]|nr:iron ABC transporter permease [Deltaproteobacteria bacterium]